MLRWKRISESRISPKPLVNKEDCKKACLQSAEHHPSATLSLAEHAWISAHPAIIIETLLKISYT